MPVSQAKRGSGELELIVRSISIRLETENIVLATSSNGQPFARYHIHRGFVKDKDEEEVGLLYTTTDMAMPKVSGNPRTIPKLDASSSKPQLTLPPLLSGRTNPILLPP